MRRVLIVEDDADLLHLLSQEVEGFGYEVTLASTAAEALRLAEARDPTAIILDIALPDAAGTSTLDSLQERHPGVPVIMLTGNADEQLARETLKRGAFDYIMKPFDAERLGRVLETAVAGSAARKR